MSIIKVLAKNHNMRKLRKFSLLVLLVLTGCKTAVPTTATTQPLTTTAPAAPTRTPAEFTPEAIRTIPLDPGQINGQTIEFLHPWDGSRGEVLDMLIARFNAENGLGITVLDSFSANLFEEVGERLKNGTAPDVTAGFNYHALAWLSHAELPNLTPYITDPFWGLSQAEIEDFLPAFLEQARQENEVYGLPFYRTAEVLLYNETWAGELGFSTYPGTPEALQEQACAANASAKLDNGGAFTPHGGLSLNFEPLAMVAWITAFGGGIGPVFENESYTFDRQENLEAFTFLRRLLDENCAWVPEDQYPHEDFANRRSLFLSTTLAGIFPQFDAMEVAGSDDRWSALPYPHLEGSARALVYGPDLVLLPGEPEAQLAGWVFMKWLTTPENNRAWFEETGYYPVRSSGLAAITLQDLQDADWISGGDPLPALPTWPYVQWVVSDTARVIFAPLITVDDIEAIAEELDNLAEEVAGLKR